MWWQALGMVPPYTFTSHLESLALSLSCVPHSGFLLMCTRADSRCQVRELGPYHFHGRPQLSSWLLASLWLRSSCCGYLGIELVDGSSLSPCLCLYAFEVDEIDETLYVEKQGIWGSHYLIIGTGSHPKLIALQNMVASL